MNQHNNEELCECCHHLMWAMLETLFEEKEDKSGRKVGGIEQQIKRRILDERNLNRGVNHNNSITVNIINIDNDKKSQYLKTALVDTRSIKTRI